VDHLHLLRRVMKKPSTGDLVSLQTVLLSWEEKAGTPEEGQRSADTLALLGDFYCFLTGLECKLEAHAFAELASRMDMGAVGGVIAENVLGAGPKLLERVLVGGLSEVLMVLASRQYVKAFDRELETFHQQVAWKLRAHFWHFSAVHRPELSPEQRAALIDELFTPLFDRKSPGEAKSIALAYLFQLLLLGTLLG
jgi:hypothetical protein